MKTFKTCTAIGHSGYFRPGEFVVVPVPSPLFSPKQVAEALQVSESSVKRWCDQGLIPMVRTAGGHRRISLDDLMRFTAESERPLLNPIAIGLSVPPPAPATIRPTAGSQEQIAFRQALSAGNEAACRQIFQRLSEISGSVAVASELLITDALHRVGEAWERQELDVYHERRGCEICIRLVAEARGRLPTPVGPVAIGAALEGDFYQLPTALVELALREAGWQAESLGVNLPFRTIAAAVADYRPKLLWLSVSQIGSEETFVERFNQLAEGLPEDCALLVGGRALNDAVRPRLKYTAHCDSLRQLVGLADVLRQQAGNSYANPAAPPKPSTN